ncbi:hypothetical protein DIZ81_11035 [Legionella taurinensis]|uniref:U-box domain-containing protein n=1 Tax=Legionella taurinensis TaxID=70611 RepID=A0AB38N3Y3_9GAMM|nr:U-box domain-containing protein [Legionella taurinensis]MDX1838385.1 U-box domain-containing protein [Legionella taurinensis]PUT39145.1 hypothetical protein DB744_11045 [Legionella taurinensis]PUT39770.1 hypothetical protein DB746_13220 [Legionella taurinensis]PUT43601.1 hypothetical protein DB743_10435 [Legionella taurinensis]PUT45257.1 hypothetical protein DB745_13160 [Legionella taurinensis]
MKKDRVPTTFFCPITHEPMRHPVYVYPHHYELSALLDWFKQGHRTSPLTREQVAYVIYDKDFKQKLDTLNPVDRYQEYDGAAAFNELQACLNHPYDPYRQEMNKTGALLFFTAAFFALLMKTMGSKDGQAPQADLADLLLCLFLVAGCRSLYKLVEHRAPGFFKPRPPMTPSQSETAPDLNGRDEGPLGIDCNG